MWELKLKSAGFIYLVAAEFEILQHNTNEASNSQEHNTNSTKSFCYIA